LATLAFAGMIGGCSGDKVSSGDTSDAVKEVEKNMAHTGERPATPPKRLPDGVQNVGMGGGGGSGKFRKAGGG